MRLTFHLCTKQIIFSFTVEMATTNRIDVLFDGYSKNTAADVMEANCTSTLVRGKETITIVDTRTAWDGEELIAGKYTS